MTQLHFKIDKATKRITIIPRKGDTVLQFNGRRHDMFYRSLGQAFIKLADKADQLMQEKRQ